MATEHVNISSVAEVLPGFAVKGRVEHVPDGQWQLIQGKHLTPGEPYCYRPEHELRINPERNVAPYQVEPGDVLIASRGTSNYAVAILEVPDRTIAPAAFYILRPDSDVDAIYLAWVLQQAPVQAQIARVRTGTLTPILQRANFKGVRIPLPPLEEQRRIAKLAGLMARERDLLQQLQVATARYHDTVGRALLAGRLHAPREGPHL
jgi:type I restriction enzyme S subunit